MRREVGGGLASLLTRKVISSVGGEHLTLTGANILKGPSGSNTLENRRWVLVHTDASRDRGAVVAAIALAPTCRGRSKPDRKQKSPSSLICSDMMTSSI